MSKINSFNIKNNTALVDDKIMSIDFSSIVNSNLSKNGLQSMRNISTNEIYEQNKHNDSNYFGVDLQKSNYNQFASKSISISPNKNTTQNNISCEVKESSHSPRKMDRIKKESISSLNNLDINNVLSSIKFAEHKENNPTDYSNDSKQLDLSQFNSVSTVNNFQTNQLPGLSTLNSGFNINNSNNNTVLDESLSIDFLNSLPSKNRSTTVKEVSHQDKNNFTNRSIDFGTMDRKVSLQTNKFNNFDIDIFSNRTEVEDIFDPNLIKRQLRGVIIVIHIII